MNPHLFTILTCFVLLGPGPGCSNNSKQSSGKACKEMLSDKIGRALVEGLVQEASGRSDTDLDSDTLLKECTAIPAKVLRCYRQFDLESPACDAAISKFLGLADSTPKTTGPEPVHSVAIEKDWYDAVATDQGLVVLAYETKVVAFSKGAVRWQRELQDFSSRLVPFDDCVLAPTAAGLHCLGYQHGKDLWVAARPEDDTEMVSSIAVHGDKAYYVGAEGKVRSLVRTDCVRSSADCVQDTSIRVDPFGGDVGFAFAEDGHWAMSESNRTRLFSPDGAEVWGRGGYESDFPAASANEIAFMSGAQLLSLDAAACAQSPRKCERTLATVGDDASGAVLLSTGDVAVIEEAGVVAAYGTANWKIDIGNDGDLLVLGGHLYSVGHYVGLGNMSKPPTLRSINPKTGATEWLTELPGRTGMMDAPKLLSAGPKTLAVVDPVNGQIHWLPIAAN